MFDSSSRYFSPVIGTKPSRHESSKRRPKSLEPPHIHPSPTSSSSDEGREIHSAPDWSTPSDSTHHLDLLSCECCIVVVDDELPSWQAFRTEPSRPQAATDSSSGDGREGDHQRLTRRLPLLRWMEVLHGSQPITETTTNTISGGSFCR